MFKELQGASHFSKIVLRPRCHYLRDRDKDIQKLMFKTRYDHYEFVVISIGLTNTLVAFIELTNRVHKQYLDIFVIIFINDILIYPRNEEKYATHLMVVMQTLKDWQLFS